MSHPITVVETPLFIREASRLLSDKNRLELVEFLAKNPESGVIMQGTGGVRKLRWARPGKGKSGGFRVIYYYYNETIPLFALNVFAKSEKINLTGDEKNALKKITSQIVEEYKKETAKNDKSRKPHTRKR